MADEKWTEQMERKAVSLWGCSRAGLIVHLA
jgi:hypothetical protein